MQPLSKRHIYCHQQLPSHQTDNHENQGGSMSEPSISSVCSSQCTESCKKSSLSSSSLPVTLKEHIINHQTHFDCEQRLQSNSNDLISVHSDNANNLAINTNEMKRVQFLDSSTSTEPNSLSLLFEQATHSSDPLGSSHVIIKNAPYLSFID